MLSEDLAATGQLPGSARGIAILKDVDGVIYERVIASDEVILNLERQLIDHLNESACSDAFLQRLSDYCNKRLEARKAALTSGRASILGPDANWHLI